MYSGIVDRMSDVFDRRHAKLAFVRVQGEVIFVHAFECSLEIREKLVFRGAVDEDVVKVDLQYDVLQAGKDPLNHLHEVATPPLGGP